MDESGQPGDAARADGVGDAGPRGDRAEPSAWSAPDGAWPGAGSPLDPGPWGRDTERRAGFGWADGRGRFGDLLAQLTPPAPGVPVNGRPVNGHAVNGHDRHAGRAGDDHREYDDQWPGDPRPAGGVPVSAVPYPYEGDLDDARRADPPGPGPTADSAGLPTERPGPPTERPNLHTERPGLPTERPGLPTERPGLPTERPGLPTERPGPQGAERSVLPFERRPRAERSGLSGERSGLSGERSGLSGERSGLSGERPGRSDERPGTGREPGGEYPRHALRDPAPPEARPPAPSPWREALQPQPATSPVQPTTAVPLYGTDQSSPAPYEAGRYQSSGYEPAAYPPVPSYPSPFEPARFDGGPFGPRPVPEAAPAQPPFGPASPVGPPAEPAGPVDDADSEGAAAALPQRVPAQPDVPIVPEPPSVESPAEPPELARIASHLRRDDPPPQQRPDGFDVKAILAAVREVAGVRDASLRTTPAGAHSLRLELAEGADPAEVSRVVARLLSDRMGLSAAPQLPGLDPTPGYPGRATPYVPAQAQPHRRSSLPPVSPASGGQAGGTSWPFGGSSDAPPSGPPGPGSAAATPAIPSPESPAPPPRVIGRSAPTSPAWLNPPPQSPADAQPPGQSPPFTPEPNTQPPLGVEPLASRRTSSGARGRATVDPRIGERDTAEPPADDPTGAASLPATDRVQRAMAGPDGEVAPARPLAPGHPPAPRVLIDHVRVSTFGIDATVEVRLAVGDRAATGVATGPAVDAYVVRLCATATATAVDELLSLADQPHGPVRCFVEHAAAVPFGSCEVAVVVLLLTCAGWVEQLAGSAVVAGDQRQAAVRATLAAVNRRLEALLS